MIQKETTTHYRAICDNCEKFSLWAKSKDEALDIARYVGWECREHWEGIVLTTTVLCPACRAKKEGG
jgi:hypothetical protein